MAHGLNSTKSPARPARQAIEKASENSIDAFQNVHRKISNLAMRAARRAQNRILDNEGRNPGTTIFSK
ncbi:MAG TPA: hypothetical protein VGN01_05125 [Acidobacteriaceae bacterium]|jgi:hypothetical protein